MQALGDIQTRLKQLGFNPNGWGRTEARELPHILLPDEEVYDLVNGVYEGGFALLVGTNHRILLIDKKPLNYLTVEDLRFDMISEIDFNSRLIGANMCVSTGTKNLEFWSLNQQRLRKLTSHMQHRMAEIKNITNDHRQNQQEHLEQINKHLKIYLGAQQAQQQEIKQTLNSQKRLEDSVFDTEHRASDYLYAQSLLNQNPNTRQYANSEILDNALRNPEDAQQLVQNQQQIANDLYLSGIKEVFGRAESPQRRAFSREKIYSFEIDPLRISYSMLPTILRDRFLNRTAKRVA